MTAPTPSLDELRWGPPAQSDQMSFTRLHSIVNDPDDLDDGTPDERTVIGARNVRRPAPLIDLAVIHLERYAELLDTLRGQGIEPVWEDEAGEIIGDGNDPRALAGRLRMPATS